jgi:hypothetical protein
MKRRLDAAAKKSGRSQSQEAEFRLERDFLVHDTKIGRPPLREPEDSERFQIGVRVTPEMKRRLAANGRSISQEAEMRIQQSFWLEDLLKARLLSPNAVPPENVE